MSLNILIVDDDERILSILKGLLTEEGHNIVDCSDGLEAIKNCREKKFDLVIPDLMMPGRGGLEVLREVRKTNKETLVILITGFASLESAIDAIREGAYDYITKPFKLEQIKIVVNNADERIRLVHENQRLLQELKDAYSQLNIVKKIMNVKEDTNTSEDKQNDAKNQPEPLIAGSMLPYYYAEKNPIINMPVLSDLERISILRDKGFLSEEEFNLCKTKLLKPLKH